jgi:hypothetical protein
MTRHTYKTTEGARSVTALKVNSVGFDWDLRVAPEARARILKDGLLVEVRRKPVGPRSEGLCGAPVVAFMGAAALPGVHPVRDLLRLACGREDGSLVGAQHLE